MTRGERNTWRTTWNWFKKKKNALNNAELRGVTRRKKEDEEVKNKEERPNCKQKNDKLAKNKCMQRQVPD